MAQKDDDIHKAISNLAYKHNVNCIYSINESVRDAQYMGQSYLPAIGKALQLCGVTCQGIRLRGKTHTDAGGWLSGVS